MQHPIFQTLSGELGTITLWKFWDYCIDLTDLISKNKLFKFRELLIFTLIAKVSAF